MFRCTIGAAAVSDSAQRQLAHHRRGPERGGGPGAGDPSLWHPRPFIRSSLAWACSCCGICMALTRHAALYGLQVQKHARTACEHAAGGAPLTLLWHEPPFTESVPETETCLTQ